MDHWADVVAGFATIVLMPLTYSISLGLTFGFLFWVILTAVSGNFKKIHPVMWIVALLSALNLWISL